MVPFVDPSHKNQRRSELPNRDYKVLGDLEKEEFILKNEHMFYSYFFNF